METVSKVDKQIESLPKKELHKLKSLIRITYFHSKEDMARNKEILFSNKWWRESQGIRKLEQVIALYEKAGVSEADSQHHWLFNRNEQIALHYSQKHMAKPERKDNKTYINFGNHCSNRNKIRYPKKCRKTAWKRFYKLFPHLKPEEENIVTNLN
jgi:hypothetical protein